MAHKPTSLIPRTHRELCEIAERWLIGTKRCRIAIAEPNCIIVNEMPDAIGFGGGASILVEAKTSRADFLADLKKPFRSNPQEGMGTFRYYMSEPGIIMENDLPERWGLLYVVPGGRVKEIRPSGRFKDANRLEEINLLAACIYLKKPLKIRFS